MQLFELTEYLNTFLEIKRFSDCCPNGLQVEGRPEIKKIVSGVTACLPFLQAAIDVKADAVLVHHGFFWKNDSPRIVGQLRKRLDVLIKNNISLLAYHLPLDTHPKVGNNVLLAEKLGLKPKSKLASVDGLQIGLVGQLKEPLSGGDFADYIQEVLQREPFYIPGAAERIETVAWCTGAAQGFIRDAIVQNVDAYITGEVSEPTFHAANESGIHFYAAGHHATERYGVQALGEHVAKQFKIEHAFIDIDNPV